MALEGVFINCDRDIKGFSAAFSRHFLLVLDVLFTYLLGLYLIALYFAIICNSIYKHFHEYEGNDDFYVASKGPKTFTVEAPVDIG